MNYNRKKQLCKYIQLSSTFQILEEKTRNARFYAQMMHNKTNCETQQLILNRQIKTDSIKKK